MKKRLFACLLAACLAVSVLVLPASAASLNNSAIQTAITLGAMDTSQTGSLDAAVTRGAFAKMLVSFSAYRESASQQGNLGTLYKDVPGSSQWAPYVRIAVQQGWMNGYTDGTFRPDNTVTLEEACTAALKLLGYKMTDLNGVFPTAQLNKAQELGLRNQLNRSQSEAMNYEDCALLLYNTLTANTASGSAYGTSLGFTVSNGQVDTSTVMLKSLKGPFVAAEGTQLPFTPVSIYRNDKVSASAELNRYDVYYYSESLQTVWIYTRKAAGRITAVSPSASAPTAVTVAGTSYQLGSTAVASKVSSLNGGGVGEVVTLLLGMNNEAADVITGAEADEVFYGVVQGAARSLVEDNGADVLQRVAVMCTDGVQRTVNVDKSLNYPKGWLVEIRVTPEGESVSGIENKVVTGKVNADATALGSYALADDVQILDTTAEGVAGTVRPSRLAGTDLNLLNVRYYTLNEKGEIDRLILNDVTGDLWTYGVLDDIKNVAVNYSELQTLAKIIATGKSDSTDTQDKIVDDLKDVLVPTTSEVLWGVITGDILNSLRTTGKTLCVVGDGYTMQIAGSGVKSTTSELDTMLILTESDQGIEFELDKGKALPCSVRIDLDVSTYTRLYLYNAVSNKWQYLNSYTDGIITADTAGRYLLTNQNLKFANINWTFFIAGGVVVVLIGIAYVVLKKRYWFW